MDFTLNSTDEEKHSAAHVLAAAVKRIFPEVKIGVGPVTKNGFYYDFDISEEEIKEQLGSIENNANQIIQENLPFRQIFIKKDIGINTLLNMGQIYKAEIINSIIDDELSFYWLGDEFIDLCRGPHVKTTNVLGLIKIHSVQTVHWLDNPDRPKLTRVNCLLFKNGSEMLEFYNSQKKIQNRDFIKIGLRFNLITGREEIKYLTRGTRIKRQMQAFTLIKLKELNPQEIDTNTLENFLQLVKKETNKSYKEGSQAYFSTIKKSSEIRGFKYANSDQLVTKALFPESITLTSTLIILETVIGLLELVSDSIQADIYTQELDNNLTSTISSFLQKKVISHNKIISKLPENTLTSIYFKFIDSVKTEWVVSEIQIYTDASKYKDNNNQPRNFIGVTAITDVVKYLAFTLEEKGLKIPTTIHPITARIIPINKNYISYAKEIQKQLLQNNYFTDIDYSSRSFKSKIKRSENTQIPFILIVGNKEQQNKAVSLRYNGSEIGLMSIQDVLNKINEERNI